MMQGRAVTCWVLEGLERWMGYCARLCKLHAVQLDEIRISLGEAIPTVSGFRSL